ncbi:hypothetical protein H6G20_00170 [Desertifilum sp. FACHB-1129]|uniref:Uncharacterized protein n=2 Tax=Desertifilum tharense IPPAS B-1220 TaxID=1781255 RepID=A0A1E5QJD7_9CYAN|nr:MULTISPECIES: hypothetical protein [Desertifilum]MDA0211572.1 hypothetical protein [Cyanobacteria bacterium FC1]MBD2310096.1 hypothetical protein [Desertifilum sp. FACHB-1129]MBD2322100.1 hypothetical protein [Desertifilum sp. FACHB-866]MBD2333821.1 hypothetical protein [Desertifilum sp. FACHB-868]OEJ74782.1 hypothetical protein BH720_12960 [Desertifilum tharense IPPAS B-1220]
MAQLPIDVVTTVLELQRQLLEVIHQSSITGFQIFQQYGETETTLIVLEDLDHVREKANLYYSRFSTLLVRIAESQPTPDPAMLELLNRSIEMAQATIEATEATIQEERRNFNLL